MSDDRSPGLPRRYVTPRYERITKARYSAKRRANRPPGSCINENQAGTHGPATHGVRCEACVATHKRSA